MPQPFEGDAIAKVRIDGAEFIMHRYNSALFTHMSHLAMYDHVFLETNENEAGAYIFRQNEGYGRLANWMRRNRFPAHLNITEVAEADMGAFDKTLRAQARDLEQGVPPDWSGIL